MGNKIFRPIKNVVLISPDNPMGGQRVSKGGILAPDGSYFGDVCERCHTGTVLRIGNTVSLVKVGDKIAYTPFSVKKVGDDGLLTIREDFIMGVIE